MGLVLRILSQAIEGGEDGEALGGNNILLFFLLITLTLTLTQLSLSEVAEI